MPTTYLLLRNNKQTGPHSLEELLQQSLKPQDLVWAEGQSAGWRYPSEIDALKHFLQNEKGTNTPTFTTSTSAQRSVTDTAARNTQRRHSHIYVSLPAGRTAVDETPSEPSLEAKAEALYQRVQAYAQGHPTADDTDTRYARSLDDMKQEYGTWLLQQQKKKKHGSIKKKVLIAASVLAVTTSGFAVSKWISNRTTHEKPSAPYILKAEEAVRKEPTAVLGFETTDTFTISNGLPVLQNTLSELVAAPQKTIKKPINTRPKNTKSAQTITTTITNDTISQATPPPIYEAEQTRETEVKKVVPLSQQVTVTSTAEYDRKGTTLLASEVTLRNNSTETLKLVAVAVTYYKKQDRPLSKETLYFYNVQPASAPIIKVMPARKAVAARFQIGAITRADGSLYIIH